MQQQQWTAVVKRIRIWKRIKTKQPKKLRGNVYYFGKWKWIFGRAALLSLRYKTKWTFFISLDRRFWKKKKNINSFILNRPNVLPMYIVYRIYPVCAALSPFMNAYRVYNTCLLILVFRYFFFRIHMIRLHINNNTTKSCSLNNFTTKFSVLFFSLEKAEADFVGDKIKDPTLRRNFQMK